LHDGEELGGIEVLLCLKGSLNIFTGPQICPLRRATAQLKLADESNTLYFKINTHT